MSSEMDLWWILNILRDLTIRTGRPSILGYKVFRAMHDFFISTALVAYEMKEAAHVQPGGRLKP